MPTGANDTDCQDF